MGTKLNEVPKKFDEFFWGRHRYVSNDVRILRDSIKVEKCQVNMQSCQFLQRAFPDFMKTVKIMVR